MADLHDDLQRIYGLTPKGQQEIGAGATNLPAQQLELLVRIDGRLSAAQIKTGMNVPDSAFGSALRSLIAAGLVMPVVTDPFTLEFQRDLDSMAKASDEAEIDGSLASLRRKGYYVRIARERISPRPPTGGQPLSAVVIEDEPTVRKFVETLLKLQGFTVRVAGQRAEVLAELNRAPVPDLILLDVGLPDLNGFDVLAKVRAHSLLRHAGVIMLTGADTREAVIKGLAGGADGYLTKPVDPESLLRAVRAVVGLPEPKEDSPWSTDPKDRKFQ
jgi:two-component system OmpR family response regulator